MLVNNPVNYQSIDIVNRLISSPDTVSLLTKQFLHLYIVNSLESCDNAQLEKSQQQRLVRLLSLLIQNLIRNHIFTVNGKEDDDTQLLLQVKAFCLRFVRVSEASQLYKLLEKQLK